MNRFCPECETECEDKSYEDDDYGDPDHTAVTYYFECENCGCEFSVTIRTDENEPEITKHGKNYDEETEEVKE
jgi:hypothetical protein